MRAAASAVMPLRSSVVGCNSFCTDGLPSSVTVKLVGAAEAAAAPRAAPRPAPRPAAPRPAPRPALCSVKLAAWVATEAAVAAVAAAVASSAAFCAACAAAIACCNCCVWRSATAAAVPSAGAVSVAGLGCTAPGGVPVGAFAGFDSVGGGALSSTRSEALDWAELCRRGACGAVGAEGESKDEGERKPERWGRALGAKVGG